MKKAIVIEKNGKRLALTKVSSAMILAHKVLAVANIVASIFCVLQKHYAFALMDLIASFLSYIVSYFNERNNEIFDFFDNEKDNN